ncbi:MAG TPA: glycosyltransferase family 4 protein, partial [Bryobacteraceae bacterium]|nr:glycosyltransferase family 4 protein [Bryobacteraceae bacterium]
MRIAFFSPMPPAKSGIADYSEALVDELAKIASVDVFSEAAPDLDRSRYDVALYQIGNNPFHTFAYEQALEWPGVVVLHEANLHHLITDLTIRRQDWDAYLAEVAFDGGPQALEYACKYVRTLQRGPDYDGVPMLRRICSVSTGVIAHSAFVEQAARAAGFNGPSAVIPHGAWIPEANRIQWRHKLGIRDQSPLFGVFGFLKAYKRIEPTLRAFARLVRLQPSAKLILVGEPHPELPIYDLIDRFGLAENARVIGFAPIEDFVGYIAACDAIVNLRFPTVGESSGTLLRALGLGKATIVSDVGSFAELPDEICLKVPVDSTEEDLLFEYMNLLAMRPSIRDRLGAAARTWVSQECPWDLVARRYLDFLEGKPSCRNEAKPFCRNEAKSSALGDTTSVEDAPEPEPSAPVEPSYLIGWARQDASGEAYVRGHLTRLTKTLEMTPPGTVNDAILEMGA